jgi:geranylgeranyl pyrophosphate synthase
MDNDALRRGRPTTHIIYGEAKALLVGDGLLTHAFTLVSSRGRSAPWLETLSSREEACDVAETLAAAAGPYGMVGGQWLDIAATGHANKDQRRGTLTPKDFRTVENIHRLKTGRLLGAALECGVVHGIAHLRASLEPETFEHLLSSAREKARLAGELTGVAFQIVDDILDVTHTSDALGKTAGKDLETGKLTSVSTLGLEGARAQAVAFTAQAQKALSELLALAPASRKTPHGAERISPQGTTSGVAPHCANLLKQTLETMLQRET